MSSRLKVIKTIVLSSFVLISSSACGQILKDTNSIGLLKRGVDDIYDCRFERAREVAGELKGQYPNHPVIYLYSGMIKYWEKHPLIPNSQNSASYESDMLKCIKLCEEAQTYGDYPEYLLANLGARGMLLMYYADNNLTDKVNPLVISTYRYLRESFGYSSVYPDFYFFTGLYNYYREAYPEAHPIYRMLAFLFPKGDKEKGIDEIIIAAKKSIMLKAEAYSFLSYIFINFENNYQTSLTFTRGLHELYPSNRHFLAGYIKNLLLVKKYDEAEKITASLKNEAGSPYFNAQLSVFNGILKEKKYHDYVQAQRYYNKGISELSEFGYYGNDFSSYAYFGLSRISGIKNDKENRKTYRKMALQLTSYKKVNFDD
jgi:hypothetical protein